MIQVRLDTDNTFQYHNKFSFYNFDINLYFLIFVGEEGTIECLTCSLVFMGSSMAYGDNNCPQCGALQE